MNEKNLNSVLATSLNSSMFDGLQKKITPLFSLATLKKSEINFDVKITLWLSATRLVRVKAKARNFMMK